MTISKEQIEAAYNFIHTMATGMDEEGLDRENNAKHLFLAATVLQDRLTTYSQLNTDQKYVFGDCHTVDALKYMADGRGLKPSQFRKIYSQNPSVNDALAALENVALHAINQAGSFSHMEEYELVQKQVKIIEAALQRNDVPQGFVLVPIDVTPQMQKAYFDKVDEVIEFFGRYQTQRLAYASMLSAAPKPTGE